MNKLIYKKLIIMIIFLSSLIFTGCSNEIKINNANLTINETELNNNSNEEKKNLKYPYDLDKFKPVLNKSKLQAITSTYNPEYGIKYGEFENKSNKFFYLNIEDKTMNFYMCGLKNRSELRLKNTWKVETNDTKLLNATVKIKNLTSDLDEITFLQIHPDSTTRPLTNINVPLLRILWKKSYQGIDDTIWAVIRLSTDLPYSEYEKIPLIKNNNDYNNYTIKILGSKLFIFVNNEKKVELDIDYWKDIDNYFKLGVYLQSNGCGESYFKEINIIDEKI